MKIENNGQAIDKKT